MQAMSQVSLRYLEIIGLKNQNKNLENAALKKEEKRKATENNHKDLIDKNDKLMKQLTGQFPVQGENHIIWEMIITEAEKLRPYLNYILDKETIIQASRQSCTVVKEALNKKPIDTTNNTINFLNDLSEDDLKIMGIKEKISVITWARKVVGKH